MVEGDILFVALKDKRAKIALWSLFLLTGIISIMFMYFVFAAHVITTSSGTTIYSVNEDVGFIYNFTVNNSDAGQNNNLTQVNITLPSGFLFIPGSANGTNALGIFSNTSNVLTWSNFTYYLINGSQIRNFWFNATASTPGHYNITITTINSTDVLTTNISVTINDTTVPIVTINVPAIGINYTSSISFNASLNENGSMVYSLNGGITNVSMSGNQGWFGTVFNSTNSSIVNGTYTVRFYANDTSGNWNRTTLRIFGIDTNVPLISYGNGTEVDGANVTVANVYVNVTWTETNFKNITFILKNDTATVNLTTFVTATYNINWTGLPNGNYTYNVSIFDTAENFNTTANRLINIAVPTVVTTTTTGISGGSGTTPAIWKTYTNDKKELSELGNISQGLKNKERLRILFNGEKHYIGVVGLTTTAVTINVSSVSQQAILKVGEEKKFDLTANGYYDLAIKLDKIISTQANFTISYINEKIGAVSAASSSPSPSPSASPSASETPQLSPEEGFGGFNWIWVILIIIVVAVIIWMANYLWSGKRRGF